MSSTSSAELNLEYQKLADHDKFVRYAKDYGDGAGINRYKNAESYWTKASEIDLDFPDLYQYHFPLFFQAQRELERIFALRGFPNHELYATLCAATAYKNMPHVMLLWERRKLHGLKDYTLNTHELLGLTSGQHNEAGAKVQEESNGIPDALRYIMN